MAQKKQNANPVINLIVGEGRVETFEYDDEDAREEITAQEVFELIRHINDPEHPLTLEQLNVVSTDNVTVDDSSSRVSVLYTPTIPHCSMALLIGLSVKVKFKVCVRITPGTHNSEAAVNKQLSDKERVAAALENAHLLKLVNTCVATVDRSIGA